MNTPEGMRPALAALACAAVALAGFAAVAQDAPPDRSQDLAWMSAQQVYIADLKAADGWRYMEGGLYWRYLEYGGSEEKPSVADRVTVHYAGTFIDGQTFDSSYERGEPTTFPLSRLIKAWQMAIPEMGVGDTIELVAPADLAYGPTGRGPIPGGATLVFKVELLGIEKP